LRSSVPWLLLNLTLGTIFVLFIRQFEKLLFAKDSAIVFLKEIVYMSTAAVGHQFGNTKCYNFDYG